ncbi:response regulator transcription factor [Nonomuraea sp. NPDC050404]|uniref:response regulator transcription factor n=1 Tax=Nonomuraea sp. NPDC050404 TaxID=3155783 RepID=UPI0033F6E21D
MRVLIVEDDVTTSMELVRGFAERGFETITAASGRSALRLFASVDVVLLDLGLPDIDGVEVCRLIRAVSGVPIIVVSGRDNEFDRVLGLRMGADDYVVKPYRLRELTARMEAVVRRARWPREKYVLGPVRLDPHGRRVAVADRGVALTRKEFDLLILLASEPGRTFTREHIMAEVWGHDGAGDTRTLGVHVAGLRRKLGLPDFIETVRGVGFRLAVQPCSREP